MANIPKTKEDVEISRQFREQFIQKYGFIPTSVWNVKYETPLGFFSHGRTKEERAESEIIKHEKYKDWYLDDDLRETFKISWKQTKGKEAGLSVFPQDIVEKVIKFYSEPKDTILDPFAGHNSRMQTTFQLNRNYIGYDVCKEFIDFNNKIAQTLNSNFIRLNPNKTPPSIIIKFETSINISEPDNSIDLIFSSPPYWDIEYYDNDPRQLGNNSTYSRFLFDLERIFKQCYRILKPNKFFIININDFRKDGIYYDYHTDIITICKKLGFKLHDIIIMVYPTGLQQAFATQLFNNKQSAKRHEYLIVFLKT